MNPGFVVAMGVSTVFVGLISIIFVCMIMSVVVRALFKTKPAATQNSSANRTPVAPARTSAIADRDKVVVAISAAIAEEIGEDAGAIRIVSLRKI